MSRQSGSPKRAIRRRKAVNRNDKTPGGLLVEYRDEETRTIAVTGYGARVVVTNITGENEPRNRYSCTIDDTVHFELVTLPAEQLDASWFADNLGKAADQALWGLSPQGLADTLSANTPEEPPKKSRTRQLIENTVAAVIGIALYLYLILMYRQPDQ